MGESMNIQISLIHITRRGLEFDNWLLWFDEYVNGKTYHYEKQFSSLGGICFWNLEQGDVI
jgi:hypothetical protein